MKLKTLLTVLFIACIVLSARAQFNSFILTPSGDTDVFMKYVPKPVTYNGENYITGYLNMSAYKHQVSGNNSNTGMPVQKFQIQGGNILLCRTNMASTIPDLNPTSRNGAILFSDFVTSQNNWINGKWGIEYDDQYSTGGLNFFKPVSSIATDRVNFNLFMKNDGNIGIGTGDPKAKLEISDGDIFISDIDKGIIMKSPDGNCWRGTLNNNGQLIFTQLPDCATVSVKENEKELGFSFYPNPAKGYIEISLPADNKTSIASIFTINGNLVKTIEIDKQTTRINISELNSGTYILRVVSAEKMSSERFIVN